MTALGENSRKGGPLRYTNNSREQVAESNKGKDIANPMLNTFNNVKTLNIKEGALYYSGYNKDELDKVNYPESKLHKLYFEDEDKEINSSFEFGKNNNSDITFNV